MERSVILSSGPTLRAPIDEIRQDSPGGQPAADTLEEVEREHIFRVLRESGGVVSTAATRLGTAPDHPERHDAETRHLSQGFLSSHFPSDHTRSLDP